MIYSRNVPRHKENKSALTPIRRSKVKVDLKKTPLARLSTLLLYNGSLVLMLINTVLLTLFFFLWCSTAFFKDSNSLQRSVISFSFSEILNQNVNIF